MAADSNDREGRMKGGLMVEGKPPPNTSGRGRSLEVQRQQHLQIVSPATRSIPVQPVLAIQPFPHAHSYCLHKNPTLEVTERQKKTTSSTSDSLNPTERVNLSKRNLPAIPVMKNQDVVRLLSLQHNLINHMEDLQCYSNLVFLDLYNNQIKEISGLENLVALRVLMLGKNNLSRIANLQNLTHLDILDLHGNFICRIENLSHLCELRVLNLSNNQIQHVLPDDLAGLSSLNELNLNRNEIKFLAGCEQLPALRNIFLFQNHISSFNNISSLYFKASLEEVGLDGNPISRSRFYRAFILHQMSYLKVLDNKRVIETEKQHWELLLAAGAFIEPFYMQDPEHYFEKYRNIPPRPPQKPELPVVNMTSDGTLTIKGGITSIPGFDSSVRHVRALVLEDITLDALVVPSSSSLLHHVPVKVSGIEVLTLKGAEIRVLSQLHLLSQTFPNLKELYLPDSRVAALSIFRPYALCVFPHLGILNAVEALNTERFLAEKQYGWLYDVAQSCSRAATPSTSSLGFASSYVSSLVKRAVCSAKKIQGLEELWPHIVQALIKETILELEDHSLFEKSCSPELSLTAFISQSLLRSSFVRYV